MFRDGGAQPAKSDRTKAREAFFLEFAKSIRSSFPELPLMVTGGFRTRTGMEAAVVEGGCDLVGVARPAALHPTLPHSVVFNAEVKDDDAKLYTKKIPVPWLLKQIGPSVGSGAESVSAALLVTGGGWFTRASTNGHVNRLGTLSRSGKWEGCQCEGVLYITSNPDQLLPMRVGLPP